jgi:hypothetical protein
MLMGTKSFVLRRQNIFVQFSSVLLATHTHTPRVADCLYCLCFENFFHSELSYFICGSLQRHIELRRVDVCLLASGTRTARTPSCHANEADKDEAEESADLLEDVDELLPEVFVEIGVEEGIEAGRAHAGQVADGVDAEHAVGRGEQPVPLIVVQEVGDLDH